MTPVWGTERSAVYYALNIDLFATPAAVALRDHAALTRLLTLGTMFTELIGPFLAISPILTVPLRLVAVLLFLGMHIGMGLTLHLGTFPWICAAAWLSLVPGAVWDRLKWPGMWPLRSPQGTPPRPIPVWAQAITLCWLCFMALRIGHFGPRARAELHGASPGAVAGGRHPALGHVRPHPNPVRRLAGVRRCSGKTATGWMSGAAAAPLPTAQTIWEPLTGTHVGWGILLAISGHEGEPYRRYFARYLCREGRVRSLSLAFMTEHTPPPGRPIEIPERRTLWKGDCP